VEDGVRRVGRPKMRWEDGADQDTRILEVKNWKKVPSPETNGQSFLRRPGPTKVCRTNGDDPHSIGFQTSQLLVPTFKRKIICMVIARLAEKLEDTSP